MRIRRNGWEWFLNDPSVLEPWAEKMEELAADPLKRNGVRSVFRTEDSAGPGCFV